jgi:ABC transporter substrate binding protein
VKDPQSSTHRENARRTLIFSFGKSVVVAALDFILGLRLQFVNAGTEPAIDVAFAALVHVRVDALVIVTDPLFNSRPHQLVALAARYALPTIYPYREFAAAAGLMSYGGNLTEPWYLAGVYAGRILKGEKAADLPIQQTPNSRLSSISRRRHRLASRCRPRCSLAPVKAGENW